MTARLLLALALIAALCGGLWGIHHAGYKAGVAAKTAEFAAKYAEAVDVARAEEAEKRTAVETAHAKDVERLRVQTAAATAARTERDGLRQYLASRPTGAGDPATRTGADDPATLRDVLGACTERYEDVARAAGEASVQVIGLQSYIAAAIETDGQPNASAAPVGGAGRPAGSSFLVSQPLTAPPARTSSASAVHP